MVSFNFCDIFQASSVGGDKSSEISEQLTNAKVTTAISLRHNMLVTVY